MFSSDPLPLIALIAPAVKMQVVKMKEPAANRRAQCMSGKRHCWISEKGVEFKPL